MTRTLTAIVVAVALLGTGCASGEREVAPTSMAIVATTNSAPTGAPPATEAATVPVDTTGAPLAQLRLSHPETLAFAAPFTMLDRDGGLSAVAEKISIGTWASPDVLRALLVDGQSEVTAVPTYVGANLYNRGVDVRLAAVLVWGLLWLLGPDGTPANWESLRGQTVMVPFPNDLPDLVFRYLAGVNGLTPGEDFTIEYYAQPPEVVGRLVSGGGSFAVLPEHVATVALAQAGQNGRALTRLFDLQAEWAAATGSSARIPQAGVVVSEAVHERPDALAAILDALDDAVTTVNAASPETVAALSEASGVPAPLVEQVIPRLNLKVVAAGDARAELERFFTELATLSPDIIGGALPGADFYLPDPR